MTNKIVRGVDGDPRKYQILRLMTIHPPKCPDCREPAGLADEDRLIMTCDNDECKVMWYWIDIKGKILRDPNNVRRLKDHSTCKTQAQI